MVVARGEAAGAGKGGGGTKDAAVAGEPVRVHGQSGAAQELAQALVASGLPGVGAQTAASAACACRAWRSIFTPAVVCAAGLKVGWG